MPKLIVMFYAIIWSIVYPFYRTLRKDQGRFTSHCFLIGLWIVLIFIALLIFSVLDTGNVSVSYILGNAYFIIILTGIIVSFSWIYIHDHYFKIPAPMLESFVLKYAKKLLVTPNFSGTRKDEKPGTTLKKRIARNINLIASLVVGAAYIGIEIFLSIGLVKSGAQSEISGVIIFSILLVTTPAFLHFGLPIVTNLNASTKNKMLFVPILVIIPIVGLLRVSQKLTDSNTASSFSIYLITGPPVALFFWLLMVMINLYKRRVFYWLMIGTCLFFWIPVYILSPVSTTSVFGGENIISIVAYCLVGVGLASIALVILWKFVKLMFNILKDKFLGLRNTYRIYKLQKLRIELKRLKLLRLGSKMDIDRKSELDLIEKADGIMDLKDLYPYTEKEIKSIVVEDVDSPLEGLGGKDRAQTTIIPPQERALMAEIKKLSQQVIINQKIKAVDVRSQRDKLLESSAKIKLKQLIYLNLKNFGYWINASSFVVSYTFIIYIYFNLGSAASANERGVVSLSYLSNQ